MKKTHKKSLLYYVIIAYSITWVFWITAIILGYEDMSFTRLIHWNFETPGQMILFFIFRIGVYGPLIASLFITYHFSKSDGLKDLLQRMIKWNVKIKWYLFVLLIPVVLNLVVVLIGFITGISLGEFFNSEIPWTLLLVYVLYQILTSGMEEPGWRGFALNNLQNKYTAEKASWILGLIWAVWHFPLMISLYFGEEITTIVFSLAGFTMVMIGQTLIYTWFYNNTKSVLINILYHGWSNTATAFILGTVATHNPVVGLITAIATWSLAILLLKKYGSKTLTK